MAKETFSERINGRTPNGGAYAVAYFMDDKGGRCDKAVARRMEIVEYDDKDVVIARTIAEC